MLDFVLKVFSCYVYLFRVSISGVFVFGYTVCRTKFSFRFDVFCNSILIYDISIYNFTPMNEVNKQYITLQVCSLCTTGPYVTLLTH